MSARIGLLLLTALSLGAVGLPLRGAAAAATSLSYRVLGGSFGASTAGALESTAPAPGDRPFRGTLGGPLAPGLAASTGGIGAFGGFWPIAGGIGAVCADGALEAQEECDDGGTQDGDGCSATCELEDETEFHGTAEGGDVIAVDVDGVTISIVHPPGRRK